MLSGTAMLDTIRTHPRVSFAALIGLLVFVAAFRPAFMRDARPQPLSRDEVTAHALAFAALEGWSSPNRFFRTIPIEGDDAAAVRSTGAAVDRESLPDPAWETWVLADPSSISRVTSDGDVDPMLDIASTPTGDVVQYIEVSSRIVAGWGANENGSRHVPLRELPTERLFDTRAEDRLQASDQERARAVQVASAFFERHAIAATSPLVSLHIREVDKTRLAVMRWERPGPGMTAEVTRMVASPDRVLAYDRDVMTAAAVPSGRTLFDRVMLAVWISAVIAFVLGAALILVLVVIKRTQNEISLYAAVGVFAFVFALNAMTTYVVVGFTGAMTMGTLGTPFYWGGVVGTLVITPIFIVASSMLTAAAWAAGESEAYTAWPRQLVQPLSDVLRGRVRRREVGEQVALGYLLALATLGVTTTIGLAAPGSASSSVAAYGVLVGWPAGLVAPLTALASALQVGIIANVFAMSYVKRFARRTWVAVAAGSLLGIVSTLGDVSIFPSEEWTGLTVRVLLSVATALAFVRFGALASMTALFAWLGLQSTAPLLAGLTVHPSHVASGLWSAALCFAPLVAAGLAAMRPREYTGESALPAHVRRALDRLRISEEFEVARRVQAGLLPASPPRVRGLDVAGACVPANEVGGDYFDYFELDGDRLAIAVGDVSGKGVPAAIFMTLTKSYMVTQAPRAAEPAVVLSRVNAHLKRNLARGTFVTMALAVVDRAEGSVTYTRAGHNPPLLLRRDGEGDFLSASGLALGSAPSAVFDGLTRSETASIGPGDLLLLYTDGVTEAMNVRSDEYGEERLVEKASALARSGAPAQQVVDALLKDVRAFRGRALQHDDITIVAVRVL